MPSFNQRSFIVTRGGSGWIYSPSNLPFCLKLIRLWEDGNINPNFWNEAKSVSVYCAAIRFLSGTSKIPLGIQYWIGSEKNCPRRDTISLTEFFSLFSIEQDEKMKWANFILAEPELLKKLYHNRDPEKADLVLTYPILRGEKSLDAYLGKEDFSEEDALQLTQQMLSTILALYRSNCVHGDIKPSNIMISEMDGKKVFSLTDFGSLGSEKNPSESGTGIFFNADLFKYLTESKFCSPLQARTLMDCYALSRTIYALAVGRIPVSPILNPEVVTGKWPRIAKTFLRLYDAKELTIEDLETLAGRIPIAVSGQWQPFSFWEPGMPREFKLFESKKEKNGILYGRFHEQLRFTEEFDPLMKIYGAFPRHSHLYRELTDLLLLPLVSGCKSLIFHAPDDLATSRRPQDFSFYQPKTLETVSRLTKADERIIFEIGRRLNHLFQHHPEEKAYLPEKRDLVWCDGKIKLRWNTSDSRKLDRPIDYMAYFKFLISGEAAFSLCDWQTLRPKCSLLTEKLTTEQITVFFNRIPVTNLCELPDDCLMDYLRFHSHPDDYLTPEVSRKLLQKLSDSRQRTSFIELFRYPAFRKNVADSAFDFSGEQWLALREFTHEFDHRITKEIAEKMFYAANPKLRRALWKDPALHSLLEEKVWNLSGEKLFPLFEKIPDSTQYPNADDLAEAFLKMVRDFFGNRELSSHLWSVLLCRFPELWKRVPEKYFGQLTVAAWLRILGKYPEYIARCPCLKKFTRRQWDSLVLQQPQLSSFLPSDPALSEQIQKRLRKRNRSSAEPSGER